MKPRHSAIAQPLLPSSLQVWAWATLSQEHFVSVFLASFFLPVSSISHATEALGLDLQTIKRLPFLSLSLPLSLCLSLSLSLLYSSFSLTSLHNAAAKEVNDLIHFEQLSS